jgi:hypothetical protein
VNVGSFCQTNDQCCSGICTGAKGKTTCQAHDQSTCTGQNTVCGDGADAPNCTTSTGAEGYCGVTTGSARYCSAGQGSKCMACTKDADCAAQCGAGAACLSCPVCVDVGFQTACTSPAFEGCGPL